MPSRISGSHAEAQFATTGGVGARTKAYGGALTSGNLLVVTVTTDRAATLTVSGGVNGSYTQSGSYVSSRISQWRKENNGTATAETVSITPSVDCQLSVSMDEYSGTPTSSTVRATATNTGSIVTSGTGGTVAALPGDLIVLSFDYFATPTVITLLTPSTGAVGAAVTITGLNFGASQGISTVKFNGVTATVDSWANTSIATHVPVGATTGSVVVRVNGIDSAGVTFTVTAETYHYYVSTSGSDGNNGLSTGAAFATIKHALEVAAAALSGTGKTIAVLGGTYDQAVVDPSASGTSWTNKLRVVNYAGQTPLLQPSSGSFIWYCSAAQHHTEFDGIQMNGASIGDASVRWDAGTHHLRIQNADLHHREGAGNTNAAVDVVGDDCEVVRMSIHGTGGPYAVYLAGNRNLVDLCDLYAVSNGGVHVYHDTTVPTDNIVRNNHIHHINQGWFFGAPDGLMFGVLLYGSGNQAYNNVIDHIDASAFLAAHGLTIDPSSAGVTVYPRSTNAGIWFNTITANAQMPIVLVQNWTTPVPSGTIIRNNLDYNNTVGTIVDGGSGTIKDHNSTAATNPLFVSTADYHLQPGSPLKAAGVAVTSPAITTDIEGNPRNTPPSIGAFE